MTIRAKFKVTSITRQAGWNGVKEMHTVRLTPVTADTPENKAFYLATPGGSVELSLVHQSVGEQFAIGQEFYVDFTSAVEQAPVAA